MPFQGKHTSRAVAQCFLWDILDESSIVDSHRIVDPFCQSIFLAVIIFNPVKPSRVADCGMFIVRSLCVLCALLFFFLYSSIFFFVPSFALFYSAPLFYTLFLFFWSSRSSVLYFSLLYPPVFFSTLRSTLINQIHMRATL